MINHCRLASREVGDRITPDDHTGRHHAVGSRQITEEFQTRNDFGTVEGHFVETIAHHVLTITNCEALEDPVWEAIQGISKPQRSPLAIRNLSSR